MSGVLISILFNKSAVRYLLLQALIKDVSDIIIFIPSLRNSSRCSAKVNNSVSIVGIITTIELSAHIFFKKPISLTLLLILGSFLTVIFVKFIKNNLNRKKI